MRVRIRALVRVIGLGKAIMGHNGAEIGVTGAADCIDARGSQRPVHGSSLSSWRLHGGLVSASTSLKVSMPSQFISGAVFIAVVDGKQLPIHGCSWIA
jgi:hypothetical protein